jgi:hypothetical protein
MGSITTQTLETRPPSSDRPTYQKWYFATHPEKYLKRLETTQRWRESHREHLKEYDEIHNAIYWELNKERDKPKRVAYRLAHKERIQNQIVEWHKTHKEAVSRINREHWQRVKFQVLSHYANGTPKCTRCGFVDIRALSLDHIAGGGNQHRKQIGSGWYRKLRKASYPEGYQVLCMNCQWIKRVENKECDRK